MLRDVPETPEVAAFRLAVAPKANPSEASVRAHANGVASAIDGSSASSSPLTVAVASDVSGDHQLPPTPLDAQRAPLTPIAPLSSDSDDGSEYATDDGEEHIFDVTDAGELYSALAQLQQTAGLCRLRLFRANVRHNSIRDFFDVWFLAIVYFDWFNSDSVMQRMRRLERQIALAGREHWIVRALKLLAWTAWPFVAFAIARKISQLRRRSHA